jgi:hypothetical protein
MTLNIQFFVRNVYGIPHKYMVDSKEAEAIRHLTSCTTLRETDKKALEDLGVTFEQVLDPVTV